MADEVEQRRPINRKNPWLANRGLSRIIWRVKPGESEVEAALREADAGDFVP